MTERADETTSRVAPPHGFAPAVRATVAAGPWRVAVVVVAVWSVAVVAATGTMLDVARHVVPAAAALVAGLAALGWARTAGRTARASALLGAGAIVWAFAALIDASGELRSPSDVETTVAVLEITAHFLIIAAFLVLPIDGVRVRHVRALLDIVMILVATSTIAAGLRLLWLDDPGTEGGVVDFVLHPAVALLTFGLVADTLGRVPPRWRHPIAWCTAATALMVLAEFAGAAFEFGATAEPGWLTPSLWVAAWLVFAFAVRAPVDVHVPRVQSGDAGWTAVVIAVLAVGFMVWIELRHGVLHEEPSLVALGLIGTVAILLRAIAFQVESAALQRDLQRQERLASEPTGTKRRSRPPAPASGNSTSSVIGSGRRAASTRCSTARPKALRRSTSSCSRCRRRRVRSWSINSTRSATRRRPKPSSSSRLDPTATIGSRSKPEAEVGETTPAGSCR